MPKKRLGLVVGGQDSDAILAGIQKAEEWVYPPRG